MSMPGAELPKGWVQGTLADFVQPRGEKVLPSEMPQATFLGMDHIEAHTSRILGGVPASKMKSAAARFYKGDVLYGRLRPYLNKVATPSFDGLASAEFIVFPDSEVMRSHFLKLRLTASDFVSFASHLNEGDRPRVGFDQIGSFPIQLPPEPEQRRIVAKIEELFSELDKGVESLTTAREQLKAYRQSVLNEAVVGKLGRSREYPSKPLSAVVEELGQGWSPRCLNHPAADDDTWAVITTTAIQHAMFHEQQNKQLPEDLEPRPHLSIKAGDVLITRAGPRKRVGVACLVRRCRPRLMLCDKAYRLRANTSQVSPEWLEIVLNSPSILQEIEELKTGISDSGVNLTQSRFLELMVPVPALAEQKAVLKVVDSLASQMTNLETQTETTVQQADALRQSILKQAFSGQLVSQEPAEEPASALLKRIRAQSDLTSQKAKARVAVHA